MRGLVFPVVILIMITIVNCGVQSFVKLIYQVYKCFILLLAEKFVFISINFLGN